VSFSARLIAAARAIESLRHDALFVDPLANILAGRKAMAKHQVCVRVRAHTWSARGCRQCQVQQQCRATHATCVCM
jgi:O-methyltransferase involved in polyketide biosynthesis